MSQGNTVTIVGNVTRDPELRFTSSGQAVTSLSVAVNRRWKGRDDEWQEQVSYFDVTAWGQMGENVAESCPKGSRIIVTGRLEQRSWETQEGDKRSKVQIVADEIGPSLRWANAQVVKNERREAGEGGYGGKGEPKPQEAPTWNPDEEPF